MASKASSGFANNLVAEIFSAICNHASGVILTNTLGVDLVEACTTFIYTSNLITAPELEFLSFFAAGVTCNLLISFSLPEVSALTNFVCQQPNPCSMDLLTDPNNCGQCGNVVSRTSFPSYFLLLGEPNLSTSAPPASAPTASVPPLPLPSKLAALISALCRSAPALQLCTTAS
jgi:hypothetical protein